MHNISVCFRTAVFILSAVLSLGVGIVLPGSAVAHRPPPPVHHSAHVSVHHHADVNVHHHADVDVHVDHHYHDHHVDAGDVMLGAITGLAIGAVVTAASMPPTCQNIIINNISYRQCGSTWYQPYYVGTELRFQVVAPPPH